MFETPVGVTLELVQLAKRCQLYLGPDPRKVSMGAMALPVVQSPRQPQVHILDLERRWQAEDHRPLEELRCRLVLMAAKYDKVILKSIQACQWIATAKDMEMWGATYRISKRLKECLPVTVLKGLKDGIAGWTAPGARVVGNSG